MELESLEEWQLWLACGDISSLYGYCGAILPCARTGEIRLLGSCYNLYGCPGFTSILKVRRSLCQISMLLRSIVLSLCSCRVSQVMNRISGLQYGVCFLRSRLCVANISFMNPKRSSVSSCIRKPRDAGEVAEHGDQVYLCCTDKGNDKD